MRLKLFAYRLPVLGRCPLNNKTLKNEIETIQERYHLLSLLKLSITRLSRMRLKHAPSISQRPRGITLNNKTLKNEIETLLKFGGVSVIFVSQ